MNDNTAKARSKAEPEPDYDAKQDVYEDSLADEPMAAETPPASRTYADEQRPTQAELDQLFEELDNRFRTSDEQAHADQLGYQAELDAAWAEQEAQEAAEERAAYDASVEACYNEALTEAAAWGKGKS